MGACPKCDGLGQIQFFDPARIVAYPHLSLAAGAIKGWDKRNQFYFQMHRIAGGALRVQTERPSRNCRRPRPASCSTVRATTRSSSATSTKRAPASIAPTPSRASSPTSNAATARPIDGGARGTGEVPQQQALPRMRRRPPATRGAPRLRRRQDHHRDQPPVADPLPRLLQPAATQRAQGAGGREDPQGDHRAGCPS
jgi:hypothetical protein